jgi:SAM-dependent methyltransferase
MIYRYKLWGGAEQDFYSGTGSHTPEVIEPYIRSVQAFLSEYSVPPIVLDLGCGDFTVGNRLADLAQQYNACDVVPDLILRNRRLFARTNLSFHILDGVTDALPAGDLVIVKQVFQHLSNDQIAAIVRKLSPYATWVITEHVPAYEFLPNRNMQTSGYTRLQMRSGVVLTEEPFRVQPKASEILCEVPEDGDLVRTIVYRF